MKVLVLTTLVYLMWYPLACWRWPYARCRCCSGKGHHAKGTKLRDCWWCKGRGRRWRLGRRIWNYFAGVRSGVRS